MNQQINTFEELFYCIDKNGVNLCEDMHTSYWPEFGGGYKKEDTFAEYSKNYIDFLNAWHSRHEDLIVSDFSMSAHSMHYYDSVLVIEKRPLEKPYHQQTGAPTLHGM